MRKGFLLTFVFIVIISIFPVFDLFINQGTPATFDSPIHISIIAQFSRALQNGDFPVVWLNNFANYGLPVGIFSQQVPIYLGSILNLLVKTPVLSYSLTLFMGILFANIFFYKFLRIYVRFLPAIAGLTLLTLSPLRIIDIYIRGDLPEVFASMFLPLILIGIHKYLKEKKISGLFLIAISIAFLALSHPMMILIFGFIYIPYFFFILRISHKTFFSKISITKIIGYIFAIVIGLCIAGYYLIPLLSELKYFYMGNSGSSVSQYLSLNNIFTQQWFYFYKQDIATRGNFIFVGIIEIFSLLFGLFYVYISKQKDKKNLMLFFLLCGFVLLFFTTGFSSIFYEHIKILREIQFPWRMLAGFIFIPPIIYALILDSLNNSVIPLILIFVVCFIRFGQLYGKNYLVQQNNAYYSSLKNLESINLNTIWTGKTEFYPKRALQGKIIEGKGTLTPVSIKNSSRVYALVAATNVRIVDYTFYFPGWNAYIDNNNIPIEFQDPNYRGVITFKVTSGNHKVKVVFEDTKIRRLAKIITLIFSIIFIALFFAKKKIQKQLT